MRRLRFWLFAGSAGVCWVTAMVWLASYTKPLVAERTAAESDPPVARETLSLASDCGQVSVMWVRQHYALSPEQLRLWRLLRSVRPPQLGWHKPEWHAGGRWRSDWCGFRLRRWEEQPKRDARDGYGRCEYFSAAVPHWFFVIIFALLPSGWLFALHRESWRERQRQDRICLHCGYDLRATPGRCSECGTAVAGVVGTGRPRL
jgi:hypothetical protein